MYFSNPDNLELNRQIGELVRQNHSLARLQTKGCIDSALYIEKCNLNNQKIEALRKELKQDQASDRIRQLIGKTELILELLKDKKPMLEFEESILNIPKALGMAHWQLLKEDGETILRKNPTLPLTI